jgi:multiple sugar transport system ATP-binding protein
LSAGVPASFAAALKSYTGRGLLMGVRPEHVGEAGAHGDWQHAAPFKGVIEIVETIGHEVIVHVRVGTEVVIAKLRAHRVPAFGEQIELVMNCDALHLFDKDTELRLAEA